MLSRLKKLPMWVRVLLLGWAGFVVVRTLWIGPAVLLFLLLPTDYREMEEVSVKDLAADTGLTFPESSHITHFKETPPIDPVWLARIEMPVDDSGVLIRSLREHTPIDVIVVGSLTESLPWWRPGAVVVEQRFEHQESGGLVTVVISHEDGSAVAYVEHAVH